MICFGCSAKISCSEINRKRKMVHISQCSRFIYLLHCNKCNKYLIIYFFKNINN